MYRFAYPARLTPDKEDGGYVVTFRDVPEAITQGEDLGEALREAADCLEEAIAGRIDDGREIPPPSRRRAGERLVHLPLQTAMKAALHLAMRERGITKSEFARRLGVDEKEVRRLLDPRHGTRLPAMERALAVLGRHAELRVA